MNLLVKLIRSYICSFEVLYPLVLAINKTENHNISIFRAKEDKINTDCQGKRINLTVQNVKLQRSAISMCSLLQVAK